MTMPRYPKPGERWMLRPRPSPEFVCPFCGETRSISSGSGVVTICKTMPLLLCTSCLNVCPMPFGYVAIDRETVLGVIVVPYSWLEPIEEEALP